jgi:uncharacterized protein (DUF2141 family)
MMRIAVVIGFLALLLGCAKQTTPTGGPKDSEPPELLRSTPSNRQTGFKRNEIDLVFNEYVQINNAREQVIIVPTVGKKFEVTARRNKVTLKFNSELLDSTTYTINFREAIQDLTEKNASKNLTLAFSTGAYIDSLSVSGSVRDLLKDIPVENYTVALVPLSDTFNIFAHMPKYFFLTDKQGNFTIENLKKGDYRIYAFNDKNKNLRVDSQSEAFAFLVDTIRLEQPIKDLELYSILLNMRPFKLVSAKRIGHQFIVRLNKGYAIGKIASVFPDQPIYYDNPEYSTIRFYNTLTDIDSLSVHLFLTDSMNTSLDTTLYVSFNKLSIQKESFSVKPQNLSYLENRQKVQGQFAFSKPVLTILYDSIYIKLDSATTVAFSEKDFSWNPSFTLAQFNKQLPQPFEAAKPKTSRNTTQQLPRLQGAAKRTDPGSRSTIKQKPAIAFNELIITKGAIRSVEGDTLPFISSPFSIIKPETAATLFVEVAGTGNTITQLLNAKYEVIAESLSKKITFENLVPGEYLIRTILDSNANNKWDTGNYFLNQEPEAVIFYKDEKENRTITLKANWELGPLLIQY